MDQDVLCLLVGCFLVYESVNNFSRVSHPKWVNMVISINEILKKNVGIFERFHCKTEGEESL